MKILSSFLVFLFLSPQFCFSDQILQVIKEVEILSGNYALVRQEALKKAITEVSFKYAEDLIGKKISKELLLEKIIKNSKRYIYSSKTSRPVKKDNKYIVKVSLSLSLEKLRNFLLEKGLFQTDKKALKILFLVDIHNGSRSRQFSWWKNSPEEENLLKNQMLAFHKKIENSFKNYNFYIFSPIESRMFYYLPENFKTVIGAKQIKDFSKFFEADIIVEGAIEVRTILSNQFIVNSNLKIYHSHGKMISQLKRSDKTDFGNFSDSLEKWVSSFGSKIANKLVADINRSLRQGSFNFKELLLTIDRHYSYKEIAKFKKELEVLPQIRLLKEKEYLPKRIVFSVDTSLNSKKLSDLIRKKKFKNFRIKSMYYTNKNIELSLKFNQ